MTITTKEHANGRIITYVTISVDSSDLDDLEEEYFGEIYNELEEITEGKNFRCNAENGICACVKAGHQVEAVEQLFDSYDLNHHSVVFTREEIADAKARFLKDKIEREAKAINEIFSANVLPREEDDTNDELVDEPEEAISHKANQAVEDELCIINGKKVSVAEYVQFCKDIIAENEPIRAEAWIEMKKALAADKCEEHDAWLDEYAEAGFAIRQCVSDIEKLTGEIVPVDESYLEYEEQIADSDSANLGDSKAKPKSDDFTSKLAELEAEKAVAKAKADEAKTAYNAASDAYEDKRIALQDFKPKVETESAKHQDSLARAMKIALDNIQRCCREHNFKAACQEMTLYNICSNALRDLRNVA